MLIPRPETELLVEQIVKYLNGRSIEKQRIMKIVDIGTGSGCIAITLAKLFPSIKLMATDISKESLQLAKSNAEKHSVSEQLVFCENDLLTNLQGPFDIVVSNPPYIETSHLSDLMPDVRDFESWSALDGGEDGLDFYRRIIPGALKYLKKGGYWLDVGNIK